MLNTFYQYLPMILSDPSSWACLVNNNNNFGQSCWPRFDFTINMLKAPLILHGFSYDFSALMHIIERWGLGNWNGIPVYKNQPLWDFAVSQLKSNMSSNLSLPPASAVEIIESEPSFSLFVCLCEFVRPTLCTTSWVQDYVVHHPQTKGTINVVHQNIE